MKHNVSKVNDNVSVALKLYKRLEELRQLRLWVDQCYSSVPRGITATPENARKTLLRWVDYQTSLVLSSFDDITIRDPDLPKENPKAGWIEITSH